MEQTISDAQKNKQIWMEGFGWEYLEVRTVKMKKGSAHIVVMRKDGKLCLINRYGGHNGIAVELVKR